MAAVAGRRQPGLVRLAADLAPGGKRSGVCRLRGGVYVATAMVWLRVVDGVRPTTSDRAGAAIALFGMMVIVADWRN